jgi:hypothetical protein
MKNSKETLSAIHLLFICALAFAVGGRAAHAAADVANVGMVKTIAIEDIPDIHNVARIGIFVPFARSFHFSHGADYFFIADRKVPPPPVRPKAKEAGDGMPSDAQINFPKPADSPAVGMIGSGVLMSALRDRSLDESDLKGRDFHAIVFQRYPEFDLRTDFMAALRNALEARGMTTILLPIGRSDPPRLRWPAVDSDGTPYRVAERENDRPIDADILMQVSPVAFYNAVAAMNSYQRNISVGVALYRGRTKEFIGKHTFRFSENDDQFFYISYDDLLKNLDKALPALRTGLLALVPKVVDIASAARGK